MPRSNKPHIEIAHLTTPPAKNRMKWDEAYKHLICGKKVGRKGWKANSRIFITESSRFIRLESEYYRFDSKWSPYHIDFQADDWYIFGDKPENKTIFRKAINWLKVKICQV